MDFSWDEEQLDFKHSVVEFAQKELDNEMVERDHQGTFSRENWRKCANFGLLGLSFPEEYGGTEMDIMTTMLMMEGLGYGCRDNGLSFALNAQMWSVQHPLMTVGTEAQKKKYLSRLIRGEIIGAHGMTEPDSGSDAYSLRTRYEKVDGGYRINGTKMFVTSAPICDIAVVFATKDPNLGMWGITAFIVELGTPGFSLGQDIEKMGLRTSPMGELILDDVFVPEENLLGREGGGAKIFASSMEWERACILGSHLGAMDYQLQKVIAYARERKQYKQPIGKFQSVSNRIADMKVRLESARYLLYRVAWLKSIGKSATMEAAMAKLSVSEAFVRNSEDAIRILGGYGYSTEYEVERDLRDALGGTIYSGTSDIQRNIISRLAGL